MTCIFASGPGPWVFEEHIILRNLHVPMAWYPDTTIFTILRRWSASEPFAKETESGRQTKKTFRIKSLDSTWDLDRLGVIVGLQRHRKEISGILVLQLDTSPLTRVVLTVIYDGSYQLVWTPHQRLCSWKFFIVREWPVCIPIHAGKRVWASVSETWKIEEVCIEECIFEPSFLKGWKQLSQPSKDDMLACGEMLCCFQLSGDCPDELTWSGLPNHIRIQPLPATCDVASFNPYCPKTPRHPKAYAVM